MNPFELARARLFTTWPAERVCTAIDALLRDGFVVGASSYKLFGGRLGAAFSMSLGLPFLGGGAPVLRGKVGGSTGAVSLDVTVGARIELMVFGSFWLLVTVIGGAYQVVLQIRRVLAREASFDAVVEVLPGIAIMAGIVALGLGLWRHRERPRASALIEQLRLHIGASDPADSTTTPGAQPIH